jgi:hypothetical protein
MAMINMNRNCVHAGGVGVGKGVGAMLSGATADGGVGIVVGVSDGIIIGDT